jgi:hypothetical protein
MRMTGRSCLDLPDITLYLGMVRSLGVHTSVGMPQSCRPSIELGNGISIMETHDQCIFEGHMRKERC